MSVWTCEPVDPWTQLWTGRPWTGQGVGTEGDHPPPRRRLVAIPGPIVKVAMGCRKEPEIVHIAYVLQRLHFFFNFPIFL